MLLSYTVGLFLYFTTKKMIILGPTESLPDSCSVLCNHDLAVRSDYLLQPTSGGSAVIQQCGFTGKPVTLFKDSVICYHPSFLLYI